MSLQEKRCIIVGAGVSGLAAAQVLERAGWSIVMLDRNPTVGGRLATTLHNGMPLDRGFQVMLSGYPSVQERFHKHLGECLSFRPGALCFAAGDPRPLVIGDPLRDRGFWKDILPLTGFSVSDKWRMFTLSRELRRTPLEALLLTRNDGPAAVSRGPRLFHRIP